MPSLLSEPDAAALLIVNLLGAAERMEHIHRVHLVAIEDSADGVLTGDVIEVHVAGVLGLLGKGLHQLEKGVFLFIHLCVYLLCICSRMNGTAKR